MNKTTVTQLMPRANTSLFGGRFSLAACLLLCFAVKVFSENVLVPREQLSLDSGWRFHLGDIAFPIPKTVEETYRATKAGNATGPASVSFDDTDWREVNLPHDWVVEGPFDPDENISQGYRLRGLGWYRRYFKLDPADEGKHLELQFDGVATHCTVWFNGTLLARNFCGYTSFNVDITPYAQFGDKTNTIVVQVDANAKEGWWYEGGGIYRHTWLVKRNPLHIVTDGICANPIGGADGNWTLPVEVTLVNSGRESATAEVEVKLIDPAGKEIGRMTTPISAGVLDQVVAKLLLPVRSPQLWSVENPTLYQVRTLIRQSGKIVDEVTLNCGFRSLRFDAQKGFFLNEQLLKIKGVCNHQDHAGVGVAVPDALWDFRIRKLKEMGANAYRCAHHPPAKEFLDACDRLGMLVMDENRNFNTGAEGLRQLEWMVRRDRNHPSVFLWSVFNEEPMQATVQGYEMARRMTAAVKRLDATRPDTAAMNGGHLTPLNVSHAVDVVGFNYTMQDYDPFHAQHPDRPMTSSEDTSALMMRGEFATDNERHILGSYDTGEGSGGKHRDTWRAINERSFVAGTFVWTGFDYHGEPSPYTWPTVNASYGCMDLCGFPKTAFYLRQAQWIEDRPVLYLVPHWNWKGKEGLPVKVMAIANADTVALLLNGQSLGEKAVDKYEFVSWDVPYAPGRLEAIGKKAGKEVSRFAVETTGEPVALRLTPDRKTLVGDGFDAMVVTVEALDKDGRSVPTANLSVEFEFKGPGTIIGLGNGDPNSHESEKGRRRSLFNGLAQVILQSQGEQSGTFTLRASAGGLQPAEMTIQVIVPIAAAK